MTFSIVIPVYNAEKYIKECIESVDAMVIPEGSSLEVLLVENGSRDESGRICDACSRKDGKYKSLHFGKIGAYGARREGMKAASGDYIFFADADDKMDAKALVKVSKFLDCRNDADFPDIILHNAAGIETPDKRMFDFSSGFESGRIYTETEKAPFYEIMCLNDSLNALWNKAISRGLAQQVLATQGDEQKLFNHGEDLLQTAELIDKAASIVYLDEILYYYRDNAQGLTGSFHKEFLENQVDAWKAFDEYADKWTGGRFTEKIAERKTLTCTIAVKSLVYSMLGTGEKKRELQRIMNDPFYKEYALKALPQWAPEEDVFVHEIMTGAESFEKLCSLGRSYKTKAVIKKLLGRG